MIKTAREIVAEGVLRDIDALAAEVHADNVERGFFEDRNPNDPHHLLAMQMLIVTEHAEVVEEIRKPGAMPPMSEKIPDFTTEEEEMADAIIRSLDYCAFRKLRIGGAIAAKRAFNKTRGHRHGGKRA